MRKSKIVEIEGLGEVTVKEVSPYALYRALNADNKLEEVFAIAEDCTSLSRDKLKKLYPSEINDLVSAFMEVNTAFLAIADRLGIKNTIKEIASGMLKNLPPLFADSYLEVMEQMHGIMDGAAS